MAEVFDFAVDVGTNGQKSFAVLKSPFGDGYIQRMADGINNTTRKWNVTIADKYAFELQPVKDFLDRHAGAKSFLWTPPNGVQGYFVCEGYTETPAAAGLEGITAVFEEDFTP